MKIKDISKLLLEQCTDLIWMVNPDFDLIYANQAYLSLMKELTGEEKKLNTPVFTEGFGESHIEKWRAYYEKAFEGKYFEIPEHFYNNEKNETQYSEITFKPIFGEDQKVATVVCQSKDVTHLMKVRSQPEMIMDSSLDVFCTINAVGEFVYVSAASEVHWGYKPEELIGTPYIELTLDEDVSKTKETATAILNGHDTKIFHNRYRKKDGGIAYNLWSSRWDEATKLYYCIARDNEKQIEQAEKIKQSKHRFKSLVQEGSDLIGILDAEGQFIYISPTSKKILGIKPEEFIGRSPFEFIHPDDAEKSFASLQKIATESKVNIEPHRFKNKNGEWRWMETVLTNMLDNPAVNGIVANSRDITNEKNLRELHKQTSILAKIGSWEVNLITQNLFWSEEIHRLYETDPNTFVPTIDAAINFYREDFRELALSNFEECIKTGNSYEMEAIVITSNNKERWVRTTAKAEFMDGSCVRVYGSFQDIDEHKKSENRLISLAENLPGIIYEYHIHPDGTDALKHISGKVEEILGFTSKKLMENMSLAWAQIEAGGEIDEVKASIQQAIETKSKWKCQFKYMMPTSGKLCTHLAFGTPTFLADGTIVFNSILFDITKETQNEILLEQTTRLARIGSWEMDLINEDGNSMYWSPMLREIVEVDDNYSPTLTGGIEFHVGESKDRIQKALNLLITEGTEFDEEILLRTAKGNKIWGRAIGKSEMANNQRTKIYGSYQDIDKTKVAAIALEKSLKALEDYQYALNQSSIVAITDKKGVITYVNDNFCTISKYKREEIIGQTHRLINSKYHPTEFFKDLWKTIASGKIWRGEIKNEAKDGSYYWVDTTIVPFLNEKNRPIQYLAIRFDITERKKAEEENRFKANLLSMVRQGAIATDLDGVVNYWNKGAEIMYGWKPEEAIGKNIMELTTLETNKEEALQIMEMLKKGESWSGDFDVQKKDGTNFTVKITNSPIYDENNELKGIIGISTDITQEIKNKELLKQYTKELERSNEELEQFAYVTSHDLQEPLRMITGFMNQLKRKYDDQLDEKALQYIHFATDGAIRMRQIILDLLDYSKANRPSEQIEKVDLNNVLSEYKQLRRKLIAEKSASILSPELPTLLTYKAVITQIFHCLIDNAIKYVEKDVAPIVEINVEEKENEWEFSITDNGIGIAPQFFDKVFVIFQRLHNRQQYEGTGIGLSITKRSVEFLGGQIWLTSVPGEGSVFYFTIAKQH